MPGSMFLPARTARRTDAALSTLGDTSAILRRIRVGMRERVWNLLACELALRASRIFRIRERYIQGRCRGEEQLGTPGLEHLNRAELIIYTESGCKALGQHIAIELPPHASLIHAPGPAMLIVGELDGLRGRLSRNERRSA